jgi:cell wall-associated NlpC family hydrolase
MADPSATAARVVAGIALVPMLAVSLLLLVVAGAGAQASVNSAVCAGGGTAQTIGDVMLDAEQMGNAQTIVSVTAGRRLPIYAAVVAVDTSYTEVHLVNQLTETDHDSQGLFQQRVSIYTAAVADDPVKATNAFLDRLVNVPSWTSNGVGVDAQAVQISQFPARYQPNASLAEQIVGQLWPTATASAGPATTTGEGTTASAALLTAPAICAGAGGAVAGSITGPTGDNVAGTTTIPAGLVITGSRRGRVAVAFALAQLAKPYLWGGAGPDAYDCSGLTMAAWAASGVALPHLAAAQASEGTPEPTDLSQAVGGDLVMIPGADGTTAEPGHVGMVAGYVGRADGRHLYLIQAPMTGIPVELTEATEWSGQIVDVRHIH